jgi:hypothetical protein
MARRLDTTYHSPGWFGAALAAGLSLPLGVVLALGLLVLVPVPRIKEEPAKDAPAPRRVVWFEGGADAAKGREAPNKRSAFLSGQSVTVTEHHLNAWIERGREAAKSEAKARPANTGWYSLGEPNFRIVDGALHVAVPVRLSVGGIEVTVLAQTRGTFAREDGVFVFQPAEVLLGACPLHRVPGLSSRARAAVLSMPVPADLRAAWGKLANVAIEDRSLRLTYP